MKKAAILILALFIAFALVGCNVAPNIPSVTPYPTTRVSSNPATRVSPNATAPGYDTKSTNRYGDNGYTTSTNPVNNNPNLGNATDKSLEPGA